ncbi:MAG: type II toxin-antitoxin system PemK/MazF family toxin [Candidatus Rifleibacteriota bacterium]
MVIEQGDIFWLELEEPVSSEPGYKRPVVVVSNDIFNSSRIKTAVVCMLSSNLKRAEAPGNLLLKKGEADLAKPSVVNVSQIYTVNKEELSIKIGKLSKTRVNQIIRGLHLLLEPREI